MPRILFSFLALVIFAVGGSHAADTTELERAIRELPPRFVADIPMAKRDVFLQRLQQSSSIGQLDLKNGYLHHFSDNSAEGVGATSMLYMRQYRRANGGFVILTHMPKPFANGSAPRENQTFVFERRNNRWKDITGEVFPKGIDRTAHFRPQRAAKAVQYAPYVRIKRADGRGEAWDFGPRLADLIWDGHEFQKHDPGSKRLSWN